MTHQPTDDGAALAEVARQYAVAITPALEALIDPSDPHDPIARQFRPDPRELDRGPEEVGDPIGDRVHTPLKGLVHRYADRVLLKLVHVCPVYCRFCFRREMVGPEGDGTLSREEFAAAVGYIRSDTSIWEVILTGGDPFMISPRRAGEVTAALAEIAHVMVLRWHTRMPVADPARVDADFIRALKAGDKAVYVAVHVNHPRELTAEARAALARLADAGIPLLAQTVLLKGVNDDVATLEALMRGLVASRVKPYYLHHGDLAPGTSHFRTTIAEGEALTRALHARASGLCQPAYVLDLPGGHGKMPVGPVYRRAGRSEGDHLITDAAGVDHPYRDRPGD